MWKDEMQFKARQGRESAQKRAKKIIDSMCAGSQKQ